MRGPERGTKGFTLACFAYMYAEAIILHLYARLLQVSSCVPVHGSISLLSKGSFLLRFEQSENVDRTLFSRWDIY